MTKTTCSYFPIERQQPDKLRPLEYLVSAPTICLLVEKHFPLCPFTSLVVIIIAKTLLFDNFSFYVFILLVNCIDFSSSEELFLIYSSYRDKINSS
jgi:hypothetical protein